MSLSPDVARHLREHLRGQLAATLHDINTVNAATSVHPERAVRHGEELRGHDARRAFLERAIAEVDALAGE